MTELEAITLRLTRAVSPEEVFGCTAEEYPYACAQKEFRKLARFGHPDRYTDPKEKVQAGVLFQSLTEWWQKAKVKIGQGTYGTKETPDASDSVQGAVVFTAGRLSLTLLRRIHVGGTCGIFHALLENRNETKPVILKLPHAAEDSDLLLREAGALELCAEKMCSCVSDKSDEAILRAFTERLPYFYKSLPLSEKDTGKKKIANIFFYPANLEQGWFTLEEIRARYPDGVSTRIMAFIWNRVLEGLTFAHYAGIVHGALTPNHILIHAETRRGNIIDWTASCRLRHGDTLPYIDERFGEYIPREVRVNRTPTIASDLFMSAWCMVYVLGGDPKSRTIPAKTEKPIREILNRCLQPEARLRPRSADVLYEEFRQICGRIFGPKGFVELRMKE